MKSYFSKAIMSDLQIEQLHANLTKSTIQENKRGDLTIPIPWTIANALKLTSGAQMTFEITANNDIILKPQERTEYTLDEMLEGLTPELVHGEQNWGSPVGEEEW
jgi:antitoxin MazE